jgi:GTP 3',8-cyclase
VPAPSVPLVRLPVLGSARPGVGAHASVPLPTSAGVSVTQVSPRTVRLSLTDRCDLACVYCRPPTKEQFLDDSLEASAFEAMVDGLFLAGIRRFRITGGEPLLHREVVERVRSIAQRGPDDLALTTNATRLAQFAEPLRAAGLGRVTISLDSLRPEVFTRMSRGGRLDRVLAGIEAARAVGFPERKLNVVVVRGENDAELCELAEFAWSMGMTPRFIEVMPVGEGANLGASAVVGASEMRARLAPLIADERGVTDTDRGPAKYVHARRDPRLRIGFITGTTDTFCAACDRLRVGSDGFVRPCLAMEDGLPAVDQARKGDAAAVAATIDRAWQNKPDGETWKGCTEESAREVSMRAVGG